MSRPKPEHRWTVLSFKRSQLVLGPKTWVGTLLAILLVALGVWVTPTNVWAGVGIGVAGVVGATLGALFQTTPKERDLTANGASAVRGLLNIVEDVENVQVLAGQLAQAAPKNSRLTLGLADVQDRLTTVRLAVYGSMAEWDGVAPGSLDEVSRLRTEGQRALELFTKESNDDG